MTGPCFELDMRVTCRFNTKDSEGVVIDENRHGFLIILQISSLSKVGLIAVDLGWVELDLGCSRTQLGKLAIKVKATHQLTKPNPIHDQYDHPYSHLISQVKLETSSEMH